MMDLRDRMSKIVEAIRKKALVGDLVGQSGNTFQVDDGLPVVDGDTVSQNELNLAILVDETV